MRILITGGAGGLGISICSTFIEEGFEVRVFDLDNRVNRRRINRLSPDTDIFWGDITRSESVREAMEALKRASDEAVARAREVSRLSRETTEESKRVVTEAIEASIMDIKETTEVSKREIQAAITRAEAISQEAKEAAEASVRTAKDVTEGLIRAARESAGRTVKAVKEATEASAKVAREAAGVSITAFREAMTRAEANGKIARETAEASLKSYEQTFKEVGATEEVTEAESSKEILSDMGDVEEAGAAAYKAAEAALDALGKEAAAGKTSKGAKRVGKEPRGTIEARLESLARMYEVKKAKKAKEKPNAEDDSSVEE